MRCLNSTDASPEWGKLCQIWPVRAQMRSLRAQTWPKFARIGPTLVNGRPADGSTDCPTARMPDSPTAHQPNDPPPAETRLAEVRAGHEQHILQGEPHEPHLLPLGRTQRSKVYPLRVQREHLSKIVLNHGGRQSGLDSTSIDVLDSTKNIAFRWSHLCLIGTWPPSTPLLATPSIARFSPVWRVDPRRRPGASGAPASAPSHRAYCTDSRPNPRQECRFQSGKGHSSIWLLMSIAATSITRRSGADSGVPLRGQRFARVCSEPQNERLSWGS